MYSKGFFIFPLLVAKIFDVYISRYQSGPLEPTHYTSLSTATLDCLNQRNCTGIVQDYQYYRVTTGIDEIYATDEKATSYVRRGLFVFLLITTNFKMLQL